MRLVSDGESKPPPLQPDEHRFKDFVTRLLRVPKSEIEAREQERTKRSMGSHKDPKEAERASDEG